ncbi:hypothetical protein [Neisseria sp. Ec49-e6-T10]
MIDFAKLFLSIMSAIGTLFYVFGFAYMAGMGFTFGALVCLKFFGKF